MKTETIKVQPEKVMITYERENGAIVSGVLCIGGLSDEQAAAFEKARHVSVAPKCAVVDATYRTLVVAFKS